jgi:hypothetical protein
MSNIVRSALFALAGIALIGCGDTRTPLTAAPESPSAALTGRRTFTVAFNGEASGFPTGIVRLTGGGTFDPAKAGSTSEDDAPHLGGGFDCVRAVDQVPLKGCNDGEGVRWDTAQLLVTSGFKCTGKAAEPLKHGFTSDTAVVISADFYRAGDGIDESFTANMIVSTYDLDPDIDGVQNLWVQGVGCGTAFVNFNVR